LNEEQKEFAQGYRLRELVRRYSDYVGHPIEMPTVATEDPKKEPVFERVNQASALWQRNPKDITSEQYEEFYKHLAHDWEGALAHRHFKVEGTQMFAGLLFLPRRPPFDLFDKDARHGVRLYVRRVFIMDDCAELLPAYLRFMRGLIDSEDLPLNVSRELLQDNRAVQVIRKQIVNHALGMLEELSAQKLDDYQLFWSKFGAVLKEGLHYSDDEKEKQRIATLLRYESSTHPGMTSLADYVSRMKENQKAIYYATGSSRMQLESSPHLERLRKHGYEVLFMTEPVDPFAVMGLREFDDKPLISAMDDHLELEDVPDDSDKEQRENEKKQAEPLFERFKQVLGEQVEEVRASDRLTDSPVCLVTPEGAVAPHIERLMRAQNPNLPKTKRLLEVNAGHPVIVGLTQALASDATQAHLNDWIGLLYDQALIAEGSPVEDPGAFSRRLSLLMQRATP
jgi:molecular chaperone HtpG